METVILAFEGGKTMSHIRDILENAGLAACLTCHTAAEVKRLMYHQSVDTIICGYKLRDETAESLYDDLPPGCSMLVIAIRSLVDMINSPDILKLTAPVSRSELLGAVETLLQPGRRSERYLPSGRSWQEQAVIDRAKRLLMERSGITEEQAHHFLQRESMDKGMKLVQAARLILERDNQI